MPPPLTPSPSTTKLPPPPPPQLLVCGVLCAACVTYRVHTARARPSSAADDEQVNKVMWRMCTE